VCAQGKQTESDVLVRFPLFLFSPATRRRSHRHDPPLCSWVAQLHSISAPPIPCIAPTPQLYPAQDRHDRRHGLEHRLRMHFAIAIPESEAKRGDA
jgi:hypothetical protein